MSVDFKCFYTDKNSCLQNFENQTLRHVKKVAGEITAAVEDIN